MPSSPQHPLISVGSTGPVVNAGDLELLRLRLELVADAAAVGTFEWDLLTNLLVWDDRMKALVGHDADLGPSLDSFLRRMLPAVGGRRCYRGHRIVRRSAVGLPRHRLCRGHPLADRPRQGHV